MEQLQLTSVFGGPGTSSSMSSQRHIPDSMTWFSRLSSETSSVLKTDGFPLAVGETSAFQDTDEVVHETTLNL